MRRLFGKRAPDRGHHLVEAIERDGAGVDRQPPGRLLLELGDVHVAEGGQHQRARDRRRGHHQHVDRRTLAGERQALVHAEAVLLVDDGERKIAEIHLVLEQRMGADQEIDLARGEAVENAGPLAAAFAPGENRDPQPGGRGERCDGLVMLARENFRRRHQRGLSAGLDHPGGSEQRDDRLAGADVALEQAQHALRRGEIGIDVGERLDLAAR